MTTQPGTQSPISSFQARRRLAERMSTALARHVFSLPPLLRVDLGAEFQFPPAFHNPLRKLNSPTAHFLRYMPDSALLDPAQGSVYLLEYKAMTTPLYSQNRLRMLRERSGHTDLAPANVGLVETAALENYRRLAKAGLQVAVVVYCTYHPAHLLAEWEQNLVPLHSDRVRYGSSRASFTPYTNLHLDHMQPLGAFLRDEHPQLDPAALAAGVQACLAEL